MGKSFTGIWEEEEVIRKFLHGYEGGLVIA
jgi:hypothetical protein